MESDRPFRSLFAVMAVGLVALTGCNTDSEPETYSSKPLVATGRYTVGNPLLIPDSTRWFLQDSTGADSGAEHPTCKGLACTDTFHLPHSVGRDSVALELWTLGIRTTTLFFGQRGSSPSLDLKKSMLRDTLDTLLLARYAFISPNQKAVFTPLGDGAPSLAGYYASLILSGDPAFVGKPWPVGMDTNTAHLAMVYLAVKSALPVRQLLRLNLDSSAVQKNIAALIRAGVLVSADSVSMFPPYPVWIAAPLAPDDSLTIGGQQVAIRGTFSWTPGRRVVPEVEIRSATGPDTNIAYTLSNLPGSSATEWRLESSLTVRAKSTATPGTDTLIVTLATDSASVVARALLFVVPGPAAPALSPDGGSFNTVQKVVATESGPVDSIQISRDGAVWTRYSTAVELDSSATLHARAFRHGAASPVTRADFTIRIPPAPTFSPVPGIYHETQSVLVSATESDSIQVSSDNATWARYSASITVASSEKLYARSFLGGTPSATTMATFAIDLPPVPTILPGNGTFFGAQSVVVTAAGSDSIQVSTDSAAWTKYSTKIVLTTSGRILARSFLGGIASVVATASLSIRYPAVPVLAPAGGTFTGPETVTVAASGADSIQVSEDSAHWTRYLDGFPVASTRRVFARSFLGGVVSPVVSADFRIEIVALDSLLVSGQVLSPLPGSGTPEYATDTLPYHDSIAVLPRTSDTGAKATCNGKSCAIPLALTGPRTVDTIVISNGTSSRTYRLTVLRRPASPSISPDGGTFDSVQTATVAAPGADSIQISTDSSTWSKYTAPVGVAWSKTVYARAFEAGFVSLPAVAGFKIDIAHDTSLATLKVGSSITVPLVAGKTSYTTDSVSVNYLQLLVTATPTSPGATVTYNGKSSGLIDLIGPSTPVAIVVVNGGSTLTYSLKILQAQ